MERLEPAMADLVDEISKSKVVAVCQAQRKRSQQCAENDGNLFSKHPHPMQFVSHFACEKCQIPRISCALCEWRMKTHEQTHRWPNHYR
jgi:hypothetical protein